MAKEKKTLILHIGTHKTGTSSVQTTLQKNSDLLLEHKLFYPKQFPNNHSVSFYPLFLDKPEEYYFVKQYFNIHTKEDISRKIEELKIYWKSQFADFLMSDGECFIISGEDLEFLPEKGSVEELLEFVKPYFDDIKVVVYFRDPISYLLSILSEGIKFGIACFDDLSKLSKSRLNFKGPLKKYIDIFGEDNVIVRVFDRKLLVNNDIIDDFLDVIGYPKVKISESNKINLNESLGLYSAILLSERNKLSSKRNNQEEIKLFQKESVVLIKSMQRINEPKLNINVSLEKSQIDNINKHYEYINEHIKQGFKFKPLKYSTEDLEYPTLDIVPKDYILELFDKIVEDVTSARKDILIELYKARRNNKIVKIKNLVKSIFIKKHVLFDEDFYKKEYKDIETSPLKHYILTGVYEGRNPNAEFDTVEYVSNNPDTVYMAKNPIFHCTKKEGLQKIILK